MKKTKIEMVSTLVSVLLSLKTEVVILVLAVIGASIIPYNRIWYFVSSVIGIAVIIFAILVAWEYLKPSNQEHPNVASKKYPD